MVRKTVRKGQAWAGFRGWVPTVALAGLIASASGVRGQGSMSTDPIRPGPSPPGGTWIMPGTRFNPGSAIPADLDDAILVPEPALRRDYWVVHTRDCPQVMGTDPWPCLEVVQFDEAGRLVRRDPASLLAAAAGRAVLVVVSGNLTTPPIAINGGAWTFSWLRRRGALPPDALVVAFDWPSQQVYEHEVRDIEEKARRAYVAGFHLARFVQGFPTGSRVCLLGQSLGGRVVPSALHLLGGGELDSQSHDPPVWLPLSRPDLHIRAVVIAGASDHHWLRQGRRLDRALYGCEALLNLYNLCDEALVPYPLARRSGHHIAMGQLGLTSRDLDRLGPFAARYAERDMHPYLGRAHTLLGAVAHPTIARWIAPYTWAAPAPGPSGP